MTLAAMAGAVAPAVACAGDIVATGHVAAVTDGRTLQLVDRRTVRLAAIEVPDQTVAAERSRAALAALALDREVVVRRLGQAEDRYGRIRGWVTFAGDAKALQQRLIADGQAQTAARIGDPECAALLRTAERVARAGLIGLWSDPYYRPWRAEEPSRIMAAQGRFVLVEGRVQSVRTSGGTVYLNFGPSWTRDFAVTISRHDVGRFVAAGLVPQTLAGRLVGVRGVVETRGGPRIHAAVPEQIEIVGTN